MSTVCDLGLRFLTTDALWFPQTPDREYIIHVSAMEIYNEVVRDLLNPDSGALRLLDDPDVRTKMTSCLYSQ